MQARRKAICKMIARNNGVTRILFTTPEDGVHQEQYAWFNWMLEESERFVEGKPYWVIIEPAFPH